MNTTYVRAGRIAFARKGGRGEEKESECVDVALVLLSSGGVAGAGASSVS